jgi:hypothetical protein
VRTGRCVLTTSDPTFENCDGVQFSPDGTKLYVAVGDDLHRPVAKMTDE